MNFLSISKFKEQSNISSIEIISNPKNGKIFAQADNGVTFKVQQDIDVAKKMSFMYEDDINDGCIINPKNSTENVLATL